MMSLSNNRRGVIRMTDEETLKQLYRAENKAMVEKDLTTLDQLLAPMMTLTHMTGYVQPKLEWIDQIQNDEMQYLASKEEAITDVVIKGNRASLVGRNRVQAKIWGSHANTWPLQMQDIPRPSQRGTPSFGDNMG